MKKQIEFYNRQYSGREYAGVEGRLEIVALQAFVESYGLKDKRVLEVGSGRGAFQYVVRNWFGVDLAFSAGRYIRKRFVTATVEALPFQKETFDALWSICALEHVRQPEKALRELVRVLKPGGVAYLAPAWHCRSWAAEGYPVRPLSDFNWKGKLIKASIPLRNSLWFRASYTVPIRIGREILFFLNRQNPTRFRYYPLNANYTSYWCSDSDACNSMDPQEMLLWFRSRGFRTASHPTWLSRLLVRHGPIIVQKPAGTPSS